MATSVILGGARTPIGRYGGAFAGLPATDLGAVAIRAALERSGVAAERVDQVVMGQVLQAGTGQITARQAAVAAGVPKEVPAITINKVCLSGLNAVAMADQMIRCGEADVVVAGGMESMSGAPWLLPRSADGRTYGAGQAVDSMVHDGLWSTFTGQSMGESSDAVNRELGITREDQDAWAARSHHRAAAAWDADVLAEEVVPVEIAGKGGTTTVARDEGIRPDTSVERLAKLRPAFGADGTITAGNASQVSDGAAALVVARREVADALGVAPLAEVVAYGMAAGGFPYLHVVPATALERALAKAGLRSADLDRLEVNEAFAAVALHVTRLLGVPEERVNVHGGAVALGHPIGASGARLALTLVHELRRTGLALGAATICGGGGQGDALILRNVA
ncbi:MAG: acetyl-CoA C-acetyltransferase [Actinomycetota bacterium]